MSLYIYVVYNHPVDYPNHWVVRRDIVGHILVRDPEYILIRDSFDQIKDHFESQGLHFVNRLEDDDPGIYGTYL